jgi:hypothetical protein
MTARHVASLDVAAWRVAGAVILGLLTGLAAAWMWSLIEIWEMFF